MDLKGSIPAASQPRASSTGLGSLEGARDNHLAFDGVKLAGEQETFGNAWDGEAWAAGAALGTSWSGGDWNGTSWSGTSWSGTSWSSAGWGQASSGLRWD